MKKVLIIKTGYSEILDEKNNSRNVSLGDILRITPLLHLYEGSNVTWVVDIEAFPLLDGNLLIHKILPYDFTTAMQLELEEFDTVINLEKIPGICALADKIKARRSKFGFTFNSQTGEAEAYERATEILAVSGNPKLKRENTRIAQELLFEMVDKKFDGEEYVLGYSPKSSEEYDVLLNTKVGKKWPNKAWLNPNWDNLENMLVEDGLKVTRQDKQDETILSNLYSYMDWINSSKLIVTNDSLGLHLGIAMRKKVLGLFGPTSNSEVYFYNRGKAILPEPNLNCRPCFKGECKKGKNCMEEISIERVYKEIKNYIN